MPAGVILTVVMSAAVEMVMYHWGPIGYLHNEVQEAVFPVLDIVR
jgi:hypothetical protein